MRFFFCDLNAYKTVNNSSHLDTWRYNEVVSDMLIYASPHTQPVSYCIEADETWRTAAGPTAFDFYKRTDSPLIYKGLSCL